ncbi:MAG: hypothetical protein HKN01_00745 [Acidimicrobiia bacterium]|nr:hypothetical protein [Acidimicrobiia bacterium]
MANAERTPLELDDCALSVGRYSVGVPLNRTGEQLVEAYLELITMVRDSRPESLRSEDIDVIVAETGLDRTFIENRVSHHLASFA